MVQVAGNGPLGLGIDTAIGHDGIESEVQNGGSVRTLITRIGESTLPEAQHSQREAKAG